LAKARLRDQPIQPPIDTGGPFSAWIEVVRRLLVAPEQTTYYLMVRMTSPFERDSIVERAYEQYRRKNDLPSIDGIAATIFPRSFYLFSCKGDRRALYERYPAYRTRAARFFGKATAFSYFDRLTRWRPRGTPAPVNQLESFIERMRRHKTKRTAWFYYPTIDPSRDLGKIMGGPCLSAIDLKYETDANALSLFAAYRDHDFAEKALGNYVGLTYLLEFLCEHTKTEAGVVMCISTRARIEGGFGADLRRVVSAVDTAGTRSSK